MLGLIENCSSLHANLGERLVDLVTLFKPKLVVVDADRALMANGPTGGNLADVKLLKTIIASHDIVAADATTSFGLRSEQMAYIARLAQAALSCCAL